MGLQPNQSCGKFCTVYTNTNCWVSYWSELNGLKILFLKRKSWDNCQESPRKSVGVQGSPRNYCVEVWEVRWIPRKSVKFRGSLSKFFHQEILWHIFTLFYPSRCDMDYPLCILSILNYNYSKGNTRSYKIKDYTFPLISHHFLFCL